METCSKWRAHAPDYPFRGALFFCFFFLYCWHNALADQFSGAWAGRCHFYPSPNDLWIFVFASIASYCFHFSACAVCARFDAVSMRICRTQLFSHVETEYSFIVLFYSRRLCAHGTNGEGWKRKEKRETRDCILHVGVWPWRVNQIVVNNTATCSRHCSESSVFDFSFRLFQFCQHFVWFLFIYFFLYFFSAWSCA